MGIVTIQPGTRGADFAYLTDSIKRWLIDNEIAYVLRYVVPASWTRINKDYREWETAWYAEHGIAVVPNFERHHDDATRADDDHKQGQINGRVFVELCERFGFPPEIPHFCSVDQDIWYRNIAEAERYVRGFASVLDGRPLGLYGDDDITYRVRDLNPVQWRPAAGGWDGESRPVRTHIRQRSQVKAGSSLLDPNDTISAFAAWAPGAPDEKDNDMDTIEPVRAYDSREQYQHMVDPTLRDANKALALEPFKAWETRDVVVGYTDAAFVNVTAIGVGSSPGYISVNDENGKTSVVGFTPGTQPLSNGVPVSAPVGGKIKVTCCVGRADVAIDVFARA